MYLHVAQKQNRKKHAEWQILVCITPGSVFEVSIWIEHLLIQCVPSLNFGFLEIVQINQRVLVRWSVARLVNGADWLTTLYMFHCFFLVKNTEQPSGVMAFVFTCLYWIRSLNFPCEGHTLILGISSNWCVTFSSIISGRFNQRNLQNHFNKYLFNKYTWRLKPWK